MVEKKASTGRKKRINNEEAPHVCFSKHLQGLFNRANELSILCGAMVAIVVFSASGRSYSFGHPTIEVVMNSFLAPNFPNVLATSSDGENQQDGGGMTENMCLLLQQYTELQILVEEETKKKKSLQEAIDKEMGSRMIQWLNADICDLGADELQEFYKELQAIQGVILGKAKQVLAEGASSSQQYHIGKPSTQPKPPAMDVASGIDRDGGSENFPNNQNVG